MNRFLAMLNLCGVLALAALCAVQWRLNRRVNLEVNHLEKVRQQQQQRIEELDGHLRGARTDLDEFRGQLKATSEALKEKDLELRSARRAALQLEAEREQLKTSVTNWANAVAARDEQIHKAAEQLQKLAGERNATVEQFNELAAKYQQVVHELNARTTNYNALVERFNALSGRAGGNAPGER